MTGPKFSDFPFQTYDKIRYGDTDRQGHVNNAVFATFLETGRTFLIHRPDAPLLKPGFSFVIARLILDFKAEILWPGTVDIGTGVKTIGRSSITFAQGLFQGDNNVALSESVVVHVDNATRRSTPLDDEMREKLTALQMP